MQFKNLKALTDSIKARERVVLFPPGMFSLITLVLLLILTTVLITSSSINVFLKDINFQQQALIQFSALGISFIFAIFPNLMILSGKKHFSILSLYFAWSLLILSALILLMGLIGFVSLNNAKAPLLSCLAISLFCIYIYQSVSYRLVKEFFYLLKNPPADNS